MIPADFPTAAADTTLASGLPRWCVEGAEFVDQHGDAFSGSIAYRIERITDGQVIARNVDTGIRTRFAILPFADKCAAQFIPAIDPADAVRASLLHKLDEERGELTATIDRLTRWIETAQLANAASKPHIVEERLSLIAEELGKAQGRINARNAARRA